MVVIDPIIINLIIFVLAIYVGYHVGWNGTPALHTPLMAVTNAISAIVIVGAMLAAAVTTGGRAKSMGAIPVALAAVQEFGDVLDTRRSGDIAVALAAVDVLGDFLVTRRMLEMFKKKERKPKSAE